MGEFTPATTEQPQFSDIPLTVTEEPAQGRNESTLTVPESSPAMESHSTPVTEIPTNTETPVPETPPQADVILPKEEETMKIQITVGDTTLTAVPENNSSADTFLALLQEGQITVQMADYAGMEKVGALGTSLPRNDTQISVGAGDVILYQGNQITIYYGTNSWSFTKLAVIENATKESLFRRAWCRGCGSNIFDYTIMKIGINSVVMPIIF